MKVCVGRDLTTDSRLGNAGYSIPNCKPDTLWIDRVPGAIREKMPHRTTLKEGK